MGLFLLVYITVDIRLFNLVKIKAIDATLPNEDYILRWERLSKGAGPWRGWNMPLF